MLSYTIYYYKHRNGISQCGQMKKQACINEQGNLLPFFVSRLLASSSSSCGSLVNKPVDRHQLYFMFLISCFQNNGSDFKMSLLKILKISQNFVCFIMKFHNHQRPTNGVLKLLKCCVMGRDGSMLEKIPKLLVAPW